MTKKILIDNIEKVKNFISAMYDCPLKAELLSGNTRVNASSIMGVFSLDLTKPVDLIVHGKEQKDIDRVFNSISQYIAA